MGKARGLTARVVLLSVLLSALYTVVNTYLNVNFGMGFGFSAITILLAYGLFHKLGGSSDRREIATCVVAAGIGLPIGWTLAFIIFASERLEGLELPWWLAPPGLGSCSEVPWSSWLAPLAVLLAINALSAALGLVMASATYGLVRKAEHMVFPFYRVPASIIGACFEEGGRRLRLVAFVMALGFATTLIQHALEALGVPATLIDLSSSLPPGFILGAALSITFVACGFMVGAPVTLSMLAASLLAFAFITPYLVSTGALPTGLEPMELYREAVMAFLISPALGMMLIGGLLASLFRKLVKSLRKAGEGGEEEGGPAEGGGDREGEGGEREPQGGRREAPPSLGYGELITCFFRSLASSRRLFALYLLILASSGLLAYLLNPLAPLSPFLSAAIAILSALVLSLLDFLIILKMAGELGMTSGTHQFWLYSAPILATGYRGYAPYLAMPGQGYTGAWEGTLVVGYSKAMEEHGLELHDVVKARVACCWLTSFLASAVFILLAWRLWGLGSPQMPCISLLLSLPLVRMVAERRVSGVIDPLAFAVGAIAGGLLEALTPLSMMGVAMGLVMPPYYSVPFAAGGLLRAYLERRRGREWCRRVGMLIASALIASSVLAQLAALALMLLAR